jgi:drug/metabolite transporter (DMT)-like permease
MSGAELSVPVILLVLFAGVLHAAWNAIAKAVHDKLVAFGLMSVAFTVGGAVTLVFTGMPRHEAVVFAVVSAIIHIGYDLALLRSYRLGAFGHAYPIARGTSPVLVGVGAWLFASERLDTFATAGVLIVAAGLISIVFVSGRLERDDLPATVAAVLTGCAIASYSLVDGIGVRHAHNPMGYAALLFVMQGPPMLAVALAARWRDPAWTSRRTVPAGIAAGLLALAAYGIVIWAQTQGALAVVSALRETSVITGAVIAAVVFRENFGWRRVPAAVLVVTGIVLTQL